MRTSKSTTSLFKLRSCAKPRLVSCSTRYYYSTTPKPTFIINKSCFRKCRVGKYSKSLNIQKQQQRWYGAAASQAASSNERQQNDNYEGIDVLEFEKKLNGYNLESTGLEEYLSSGVPDIIGTNEDSYNNIFKRLIALGQLDYVPDVLVRAKEAGVPITLQFVEPIFWQVDRILPELEPGDYLIDTINMISDIIQELHGVVHGSFEREYRLLFELLDLDPKYLPLQRNLLEDIKDISDNVSDLWLRAAISTCAADEDRQFQLLTQTMVEYKVQFDLQYFHELFAVYEKQGRAKQMALVASEIVEQAKDQLLPSEREDLRSRLEKVGVNLDDFVTVAELKSTYKKPTPSVSSDSGASNPAKPTPQAGTQPTSTPSAPPTPPGPPGTGAPVQFTPSGSIASQSGGPATPPGVNASGNIAANK